MENYAEHIRNMLTVYRRDFAAGYAYLEQRLTQQWGLPPRGLTRAIHAAIVCHDLAKMDKRWQRWVRLYQQAIGKAINEPAYMAVHTHWSPAMPEHKAAKREADRQCKRPPHAGESAVAGARLIAEFCGNDSLTRAVLTAITRHHSAQANSFRDYELHPGASRAISDALAFTDLAQPQSQLLVQAPAIQLEQYLIEGKNFKEILLYFLVVRVLRLCDGLSQEE